MYLGWDSIKNVPNILRFGVFLVVHRKMAKRPANPIYGSIS